jgi:hypothetical protein
MRYRRAKQSMIGEASVDRLHDHRHAATAKRPNSLLPLRDDHEGRSRAAPTTLTINVPNGKGLPKRCGAQTATR